MSTETWWSRSEEETEGIGEHLVREHLPPDTTVLLAGDMGSGKTVLVRGFARALCIERRQVQSPTYTLIHEYQGSGGLLVHADLYRLEPGDVAGLGLEEILAGPGLKAVEWPDRLLEIPPRAARVEIFVAADGDRRIELSSG